MNAGLLNELQEKGNKDYIEAQENAENWGFDRPILGDYEDTFQDLLYGHTFDEVLEIRKSKGESTNVLDIMGSRIF